MRKKSLSFLTGILIPSLTLVLACNNRGIKSAGNPTETDQSGTSQAIGIHSLTCFSSSLYDLRPGYENKAPFVTNPDVPITLDFNSGRIVEFGGSDPDTTTLLGEPDFHHLPNGDQYYRWDATNRYGHHGTVDILFYKVPISNCDVSLTKEWTSGMGPDRVIDLLKLDRDTPFAETAQLSQQLDTKVFKFRAIQLSMTPYNSDGSLGKQSNPVTLDEPVTINRDKRQIEIFGVKTDVYDIVGAPQQRTLNDGSVSNYHAVDNKGQGCFIIIRTYTSAEYRHTVLLTIVYTVLNVNYWLRLEEEK